MVRDRNDLDRATELEEIDCEGEALQRQAPEARRRYGAISVRCFAGASRSRLKCFVIPLSKTD